jgi:hypothetical protein
MRDKPPLLLGLITQPIVLQTAADLNYSILSDGVPAWACIRHPKDVPTLIRQLFDTVQPGIHES